MDREVIDLRENTGTVAAKAWDEVCALAKGTPEYEAAVDAWLIPYNEWRQACSLQPKSREDAINGKGN